ncbi:MAG: NAD(P)/FAD-dependent oxidoreductase, partial [Myxococcales bacterium]|nr:NAD(P)/FAD-dependent oxidoreductase [Myxococcales bacterium]
MSVTTDQQHATNESYHVAIIGGGPAGLQAALVLARAGKRTVVFDSAEPARNAPSHGVHNFLGLDGLLPSEIRDLAWRQIEAYGGAERRSVEVVRVTRYTHEPFVVHDAEDRQYKADHVIAAFGYRDALPELPGFGACWADTIIACPFCDGFENRGRIWGVVPGPGCGLVASAQMAKHWGSQVLAFVPPSTQLTEQELATLAALQVDVHAGQIAQLHHRDGKLEGVSLDSGSRVAVETLLWEPPRTRAPLLNRMVEDLGLDVSDKGIVESDGRQGTNVPGLYVAGDLLGWTGALGAAGGGNVAATRIIKEWF